MNDHRVKTDDPFLLQYQPSELRIASEFLTRWRPFLSRDLCPHCTQILSDRILSLNPEVDDGDKEDVNCKENGTVLSSPNNVESENCDDNCETNSIGSWKDEADMNSLGNWKDGPNPEPEASTSATVTPSPCRLSWADMTQEDELVEEEEQQQRELYRREVSVTPFTGQLRIRVDEKPKLSREQRENIRFMNVKRKKDFICLERIKGKLVNIVDGLELHTCVFSAAEQKRIVDYVYTLEEMGRKGELKG